MAVSVSLKCAKKIDYSFHSISAGVILKRVFKSSIKTTSPTRGIESKYLDAYRSTVAVLIRYKFPPRYHDCVTYANCFSMTYLSISHSKCQRSRFSILLASLIGCSLRIGVEPQTEAQTNPMMTMRMLMWYALEREFFPINSLVTHLHM